MSYLTTVESSGMEGLELCLVDLSYSCTVRGSDMLKMKNPIKERLIEKSLATFKAVLRETPGDFSFDRVQFVSSVKNILGNDPETSGLVYLRIAKMMLNYGESMMDTSPEFNLEELFS